MESDESGELKDDVLNCICRFFANKFKYNVIKRLKNVKNGSNFLFVFLRITVYIRVHKLFRIIIV